jgi:uncharacterized protein YcbK (DUF882 family)
MGAAANSARRAFIRAGTGFLLAGLASPAFAAVKRVPIRSVAFHHLHTGEQLKVDYWVNGRYQRDALRAVNHVLRDYRTDQLHPIEPALLDLLDALRHRLGTSAPFEVISGYRSPETNELLREEGAGVAKASYHLQGKAIDIRMPGRPLRSLKRAALAMRRGGVGYYPHSDFVHVDVGPVRHW